MFSEDQMGAWKAEQFTKCTREQLKELLQELGAGPGRGAHSDEKLRELVCNALGVPFAPKAGDEPLVTVSKPERVSLLRNGANWFKHMPKLRCEPGWQGRRRLVKLHVSERLPEGCMAVIGVNGWDVGIQPDHVVSVAYPHYLNLKTTTVPVSKRTAKINPATGLPEYHTTTVHYPTYPFEDLGDDPETADKPLCAISYLQGQARSLDYFYEESRETLISIIGYLTDNTLGRDRIRDMSNTDLVEEVLNKIGLYDEALEAEREAAVA